MDTKQELEYENYITNLFNSVKMKDGGVDLRSIPVRIDGKIVAMLQPITYEYMDIFPEIVSLCGKWRKNNPTAANTDFEITDERTKRWLDLFILERKDRLLYIIDDVAHNHIGHIGFSSFNFASRTAEIDAVLRGENTDIKGLMTACVNTLKIWADKYLDLQALEVRTNEDNERAIRLYERCGFKITERIPLYRRELENEVRWDEDPTRDPKEAELFEVRMRCM